MQYFAPVNLTPDQIDFLKTTDFDISDIGENHTVNPELFIQAAGLDDFEMGNLKIISTGIEVIDKTKEITDSEIAMLTSYIKQQVRDTYGVQLQLK